jgi:hypothetical protein
MRALCVFLFLLAVPAARAGIPVEIDNASRPTSCAETDNVYVKFLAPGIRHFVIEARHPAYLTPDIQDDTAPDFATCDQSHDPSYPFAPRDITLYEDHDYKLVGHSFSSFWRPETVDFRVGNTVTSGLHLVQLIRKLPDRNVEILVVYPSDGYWRAKPLPPPGRVDTGYGSSFLVGPVETHGRPYVALSAITFDRDSLTFDLMFRSGGIGSLRVAEASSLVTRLEVALPGSTAGLPFAALRSMFVSPERADTAEARFDGSRESLSILGFASEQARSVVFDRSRPSRHNTSAPDLEFRDFTR